MKKVFVLLSVASMFAFASCSEAAKVEEKAPEATNETAPAAEEATEAVKETAEEATEAVEETTEEATETAEEATEEAHEEHAH